MSAQQIEKEGEHMRLNIHCTHNVSDLSVWVRVFVSPLDTEADSSVPLGSHYSAGRRASWSPGRKYNGRRTEGQHKSPLLAL